MAEKIGRFGTTSANYNTTNLQPPLDKIVNSGICKLRVSQYYFDEPLFDEYELTTVRATWDFQAAEAIVQNGYHILDMGCGDGRLLLYLAQKYKLANSIGIDVSTVAIDRFNSLIPSTQHSYIHARVGDIFKLPQDIIHQRFNVVTFGDATINFILDDNKLEELLNIAKQQLRDRDSLIMLAVLDNGTPERLSFMNKRCTVVPFRQNNGQASLIWWAYRYDADRLILHRSVFAQQGWNDSGDIEGVICDLQDRLWTPSSILPIAERCGLTTHRVFKSEVPDGAAVGMGTAILTLKPT
ncbi:MAG: methyltransferase domain-containing protein [Candidatus Symbiodolus clandestinus]